MRLNYEFIESLEQIHDADVVRINDLLKQLDPKAKELVKIDFLRVIDDCCFLLARDEEAQDKVVGLACLACFTTLFARHGRVEDVVVDEAYRGHGIGRKLMEMLLAMAKEEGVEEVGLTSRPSRKAANALYQSMGFQLYETNVYYKKME